MNPTSLPLACLLCLLLGLVADPAVTALAPQDQDAPTEGIRFGMSLLVLDDLDGDGAREIAVGAPAAKLGVERRYRGVALVLSGADRRVLQEWRGEDGRGLFGHALVDVGDVDGDGHGDVLVGYEGSARCEVRSSADGALLHGFDRRWQELLPFGDLDGDDRADLLLVDAPGVELRSGASGGLLNRWRLHHAERVHAAGDLDGDGLVDLVSDGEVKQLWLSGRDAVDERGRPAGPFGRGTRRTFAELWPGEPWTEASRILDVETTGDLDGDGRPDLWISVDEGERGRVLALSTARRAPLVSLQGTDDLGHALHAPGDLDGDGTPDVVVGQEIAPFTVQLRAHSGADGTELWHQGWDDDGATVEPRLASLPADAPGSHPTLLVSGCDYRWHGWVQRNGFVQCMAGDTGEVQWRLEVDDVRPLGAEDDGAIYR